MLGHCYAEHCTALRAFKGWWNRRHSIQSFGTRTATATSCTYTGRAASGTGTTTGSTISGTPIIRPSFSQLSHFSPLVGEFCFVSCPCHPPSILPTSSNGKEIAIYFLSSIDLFSQSMSNSTFTVSIFRIAIRTYGCFSSFERKPA